MSFGERLKKARKAKKLTQADLAAHLDRDFTSISKWENNKAEPDRETLIRLSEILEVKMDWLMGNTDFTEEKKIATADKSKVDITELEKLDLYYRGKKLSLLHKKAMLGIYMDLLEEEMD